jgi:C4-type Zn-finger protein
MDSRGPRTAALTYPVALDEKRMCRSRRTTVGFIAPRPRCGRRYVGEESDPPHSAHDSSVYVVSGNSARNASMTVRTASAIFLNSEIGMSMSPRPASVGISSVLDDVLDRWRQDAEAAQLLAASDGHQPKRCWRLF